MECFSFIVHLLIWTKAILVTRGDSEITTVISVDVEEIDWTRELAFDNGFKVKWFSSDQDYLTMEISALTEGYVAVGFSSNGAMRGSDIVMGWVDDTGKGHLKDLYAIGNWAPVQDQESNYELLWSSETDGETTVRFKRPWDTCDTMQDRKITNDTIRLIYAWGESDPDASLRYFKPVYHGPDSRGVQSVFLKLPTHLAKLNDQLDEPDPHVKIWDVKMDNVAIRGRSTYYYCKIVKAQHLQSKHQVIATKPILSEEHKSEIHHIIFYDCKVPEQHGGTESIFEKYLDHPGGECYLPNMPPAWSTYCNSMPLVWTIGGNGLVLPEHTGIPIGEEYNGTTYFMFEIHYNNPKRLTFTDSSGMRLFLTDKPRKYDQSVLDVRVKLSIFNPIPPSSSAFKSFGYCTSECTQKTFPAEGINVTHVMFHSHKAGRKMIVRHIRNGQELHPLAQDDFYDFNYQEFRVVQPERTILPGDILLTECTYDTTNRKKPTYPGLRVEDEMCIGFVHYYPQMNALTTCSNQLEVSTFLNGLGIKKVEEKTLTEMNLPYVSKDDELLNHDDIGNFKNSTWENPLRIFDALKIIDPPQNAHSNTSTVTRYLNSLAWGDDNERISKFVEANWLSGKQYAFCTGRGRRKVPLKDYVVPYPKFRQYQPKFNGKCATPGKLGNKRLYPRVRSYGFVNQ